MVKKAIGILMETWNGPRSVKDLIEDRKVSFLELFYDLTFVGYISRITHRFIHHFTFASIIEYLFVFMLGLWLWFNGSFYTDIHGNDDFRERVLTFLQMLMIAGMAGTAHLAFDNQTFTLFPLFAGFELVVLSAMWYATGSDPKHRPVSTPYSIVFLFSALLFMVSAVTTGSIKPILYVLAFFVSLLANVVGQVITKKNPSVNRVVITESFNERLGLFTIIVMGETIFGIIDSMSEIKHLTIQSLLAFVFVMMIAFAVWWLYFDYIYLRIPRMTIIYGGMRWVLSHIPLFIGINLMGPLLSKFIEEGQEPLESRLLLGLAFLSFFIGLFLLQVFLERFGEYGWQPVRIFMATLLIIVLILILPLDHLWLLAGMLMALNLSILKSITVGGLDAWRKVEE